MRNLSAKNRMRLQRCLSDKSSVSTKSKALAEQLELMGALPPSLRRALMMEVRIPAVGQGLLLASLLRYHTSFSEHLTCTSMHNSFCFPGESIFHQGVKCDRVYFLESGVGLYLPCSPFYPHVKVRLLFGKTCKLA